MLARGIIGQIKYSLHRRKNKTSTCAFCPKNIAVSERPVIDESGSMLILNNDFPYKKWAEQTVEQHLLLTPKRHTLQLSELTDKERDEMMQLVTIYEQKGYSFYIRSHSDRFRSVAHIHGHLFLYR